MHPTITFSYPDPRDNCLQALTYLQALLSASNCLSAQNDSDAISLNLILAQALATSAAASLEGGDVGKDA